MDESAHLPTTVTAIRRRAAQLSREVGPGGGATPALAALAALTATRPGARFVRSLLVASAVGVVAWQRRESMRQLERLIRSAEDAAVLAGSLGRWTPMFGRWAAEGDFAGMIARELERAPSLVVELGSGATTLVIADRLRRNGSGRLIAFEHDTAFAAQSRALLDGANLAEFADVVDAPLRRQHVKGRSVEWYDTRIVAEALDEAVIDVLVVDGPPQVTPWARWPALHVLHSHLADEFVALLDDGRTRATSRAVCAWRAECVDIDSYWLDTVKGTWLVRRREATGMRGPLLRAAQILNPRPSGAGRWPVHR